ncbi:MAG: hypothetical protein KGK10_08085 [Rhodospirillales bacterium]|nr:hypothetical protein [Rhodospirillales bacterium]
MADELQKDVQQDPSVPTPRLTFYRLIPSARPPQRADRSAAGSLPTRAFRYCEPVCSASAFGYYIFPPISFSLMWDGNEYTWSWEGGDGWIPLRTAQFPHFAGYFDEHVPPELKGFSPPFIGPLQEPGLVQIWTGLMVRTMPGWSLLVRPCANLPRSQAVEFYEGIIETDRWFGPLITNFRVTRTGVPVEFRADFPILQVQALPREALEERGQNDMELVPGFEQWRPEDWDNYYDTVVRPNVAEKRPRGEYAAAARRRARGGEREGSE